MGSVKLSDLPFKVGDEVNLVVYKDSHPHVMEAKLSSKKPFLVVTDVPQAGKLARQRKALVVHRHGEKITRMEVEIVEATHEDQTWVCRLEANQWHEIDRRRYPRYPVDLPVMVRMVIPEGDGFRHVEIPGNAVDLSLGGARVHLPEAVDEGTLLEFQATLGANDIVRALAVSAHVAKSDDALGLEFIDFIGGARYQLHSYLSQIAA